MERVIAINNNKGGQGKSSLVSNLGGVLGKEYNRRVLLIDTDGQGNTALAFGLNPDEFKNTLYDVIFGKVKPEEAIISVGYGVDILPSNSDMDFFDIDILTDKKRFPSPFTVLKDKLGTLAKDYDYVLIDTPPSMGLLTGNVLAFTDEVLIPFVPELFAVKGLVKIVNKVAEFRDRYNPKVKIAGVIGMMVESRTSLHSELLQDARKFTSDQAIPMFDTFIPKSIRFASATAYEGQPAVWTAKSNPIVGAYYELANELFEKHIL